MINTSGYDQRKSDFEFFKTFWVKEPTSGKKEYCIGCYSKDDWEFIHEELKKDGSLEDNIPTSSVTVTDDKLNSDTRGVYLLTDAEARISTTKRMERTPVIKGETRPKALRASGKGQGSTPSGVDVSVKCVMLVGVILVLGLLF